jgi:hypothetical protein
MIFQKYKPSSYTARQTSEFLQTFATEIIEWPAKCPDLWPIEHVWDSIGRTLQRLSQPPTMLDGPTSALCTAGLELLTTRRRKPANSIHASTN